MKKGIIAPALYFMLVSACNYSVWAAKSAETSLMEKTSGHTTLKITIKKIAVLLGRNNN